jgi:hypothetical protein
MNHSNHLPAYFYALCRRFVAACLFGALLVLWISPTLTVQAQVVGTDVGYDDFQFGSSCNSTPSGEKPQSKLWWTDGSWWGVLCSPDSLYHIYRLNLPTSYNAGGDSYSLDSGFPAVAAQGRWETMVLTKDSTGQLWITYVQDRLVMVNSSQGSDTSWGTPFQLPGSAEGTTDDISSVIAFQNQNRRDVEQRNARYHVFCHSSGLGGGWDMAVTRNCDNRSQLCRRPHQYAR